MNRYPRLMFFVWIALFLSLPVAGARAAADFSHGLINRAHALAAAATVTSQKYPDANQVIVDSMDRVHYQADGTYVEWAEGYTKILTEKGRDENTTFSSYFTIPYELAKDCRIPLLEIIKPGGQVVPIDVAKNSEVMIRPGQMRENIYNPNEKVIRVNVPGLEVGDTLHFITYDHIVQAQVHNTFCDWLSFESTTPIVHSEVEIIAPEKLPLVSIAMKDPVDKTITTDKPVHQDGTIIYRWQANNVPRMFPEPNMPPIETVTQRVLVSTVPDWQAISRWYWKLSQPHYTPDAAMKAKLAQLIQGAPSDQAKIQAIFTWVSHKVRYLGLTAEAQSPGYDPRNVAATFSDRYGVCRDKAALLAEMLRLAGFKAYPVLVDTGVKKDSEVPQPYFDHAITAVRQPDGHYLLMDSTDDNTRRLLPSYLSNKSYLVATPQGDPLRTTPIVPADQNLMQIRTTGRLDALGNLHASTELAFEGINDNAYRGYFASIQPNQRRRYFESVLQRIAPGARLDDVEIRPADLRNTAEPLSARLDYEVPQALVPGGGLNMFPVPLLGHHVGMVNFILGQTGLKKRKYPLIIDSACGVHEEVHIDLDPALGPPVAMPTSKGFSDAALSWQAHWAQTGHTFQADDEFQIKTVELSPKEYGALKDTLRMMELDERKMPIYPRNAPAPGTSPAPGTAAAQSDIDILSSQSDYQIADAHNWKETHAVTFKVLTYAGKEHFSELKIAYDPAWESVKLDDAVVTSAQGVVHHIAPGEVSVMDASDQSAPRYPVDKVLVVSFPSVEIGSTVHYQITRVFKDRPFVAIREAFRTFDPIGLKTVRVTAPAGLKLSRHVIHGMLDGRPVVTAHELKLPGAGPIPGAGEGWEWTAKNVPALHTEDTLPPEWGYVPMLFISGGNWKDYAGVVDPVLLKNAGGQPAAAAQAQALAAHLADAQAKVTALRNFVAANIRAAGDDLGSMPLSYVSPADRTLKDGYGNTTDQAVLLYSMLQAAGLKPQFVLAMDTSKVPELRDIQLANPDYQQAPAVLVRVPVGKEMVYLNDTDQYAALGATGADERMGLELAGGKLAMIHNPPDSHHRTVDGNTITLEANGDATIHQTLRFYGTQFAFWNRQFSRMRPEDRSRFFQEAVASVSQNAQAVGELKTDFSRYPGIESFTVRVKHWAVLDGDYLYMQVPQTLKGCLPLNSDTRSNPLYLGEPTRQRVNVTVHLPKGFKLLRLPEPLTQPLWGGQVAMAATVKGDEAKLTYTADFPAAMVAPSDYGELFALNRRLSRVGAGMILLERGK